MRYAFVPHDSRASVPPPRGPATPDSRADMRPCTVCGTVDRLRMYGLMTAWYGHFAGVPTDHGYFYLCPRCFSLYIPPPDLPARD